MAEKQQDGRSDSFKNKGEMEADWPAQKRQPNNTILLLGGDSPLRHTTGVEISGIGLLRSFNKYYLSLISGIYLFLLYQLGSFLASDTKLDGSF